LLTKKKKKKRESAKWLYLENMYVVTLEWV